MANVKLSQLPELTTIPDDAVIYLVHGGVSYRVTKENLVGNGTGTIPTLQEVTDQVAGNTTTNVIGVAGLTITDKITFITSLITQIRNLSFQDKDGTVALLSDIENNISGLKWKNPVVVAIDTPLGYSGLIPQMTGTTVQGVTLQHDDRVLLMSETNSANNGCYRANTTASPGNVRFYRTTDSDSEVELVNALYPVTSGTYSEKTFRQTQSTITINSTPILFDDFGNSVSQATNLVSGIMKLYAATGNNEDGTITQKALTEAFNNKADKSLSKNNLADVTIANVITAQDFFSTPLTLETGKQYTFQFSFAMSGLSSSSHILSMGFAGTASLNFMNYQALGNKSVNSLASAQAPLSFFVETNALTQISATTASTTARYVVHGFIDCTTGGTFNPQFQLSVGTTTGILKKGVCIELSKLN